MAALLSLMALAGALDPATLAWRQSCCRRGRGPLFADHRRSCRLVRQHSRSDSAHVPPRPCRIRKARWPTSCTGDYQLTVPELSRLVYVIGALCHTPTFATVVPLRESPLAQALALAGPFYHDRDRLDVRTGDNLLQLLYAEFGSAKDWDLVVRKAVALQLLSADVAAAPRCLPSTEQVDGYDCVVIDTSFGRSDIYLDNLKKVANPLNWHQNYPDAFCSMQAQNPDMFANGWSRVLETVSLSCQLGLERLVTPLKYYMSDPAPDQATLQYDLDTSGLPTLGDGKIKVDRGFIKMWATGNPGVWVRTRKIVHIEGFLPQAQACSSARSGMRSRRHRCCSATRRTRRRTPCRGKIRRHRQRPDRPAREHLATSGPTAPTGGGMASTTTQVWLDCLNDLANKNLQLSAKWCKNELTVDDLVTYTQDIGAEIASAPWRLIQALSQPTDDGGDS